MPVAVHDGIELYWECHGGVGPALVLGAGLGGAGSYWEPNIAGLMSRFRIYTFDQRGTGRSSRVGVDSIEQMSRDLVAVLDDAGLSTAHYLGHSTGAAIGLATALDHPGRLGSLMLYATTTCGDAYRRRVLGLRTQIMASMGPRAYAALTTLLLYPPYYINARHEQLLADEGDLAITFKTRHHPEISVLKRRTAAMVALVAPGHVLAAEKSIDFARLLTHPLVLPDPTFGVRQLVDAHAKRLRLPLHLIAETNSVAMTRSLARQGLGATVLPLFSVTQDLRQGTLEVVPIDDAPELRATIHLCARKDLTPSAATKAVAQVLADTFDTLFPDTAHHAR